MKIFEFQFNPKARKDRFFEAISFELEGRAQSGKGSLYVVGELANALPSNAQFLGRLVSVIKEEYYSLPKLPSPAAKFKSALRKANAFLAEETKNGNTDWLGNLHFALLAFTPSAGGLLSHFTKVGGIKIWMARNGVLVDIGKNLEDADQENQSPKVFGNVVAGKVRPEDRVMVCTKDLFELFAKENILRDFAFLKEEKQFKGVFKNKDKELSRVSGIFFFVLVEVGEREGQKEPERKGIPKQKSFPFQIPRGKLFWPPTVPLKGLSRLFIPHISVSRVSLSFFPILRKNLHLLSRSPQSLEKGKTPASPVSKSPFLRKSIPRFVFLAVLLLVGFVLFKGEEVQVSKEAQTAFEKARALQSQAENALAAESEESANLLLQEAWKVISPYTEGESARKSEKQEASKLAEKIEEKLDFLNKIEDMATPDLLLEIPPEVVSAPPQYMILSGERLYFFNPLSSELYMAGIRTAEANTLEAGRNIKYGTSFLNSAAFFAEPDALLLLSQNQNWIRTSIPLPSSNFSFDGMSSFGSSLYFFSSPTGDIMKYTNPFAGSAAPVSWIDALSEKRPLGAASIAIDGNIWILMKGGEVQRYFTGLYEKTLEPLIFPFLESASRVKTSAQVPYLYILDPPENRLVILTKFGDVVKQYRSQAFDNLLDFAVAPDGKTVYLLNGLKVYKISDIPI